MAKKLMDDAKKGSSPKEELTWKQKLMNLIPEYKDGKALESRYKKRCEELNAVIKDIMTTQELDAYEVGDIRITCSKTDKCSFIESALIEKIQELGVRGIIKTKKYIDEDALEDAIYKKKINPAALVKCQEIKSSWSLRLGKVKKNEEE